MAKRRATNLRAPYLRGIRFRDPDAPRPDGYPFDLPWLGVDFEMEFDQPVTIFMGENGSGKSTLIETLAALAGFPVSGGGAWASTDAIDPDTAFGPAALAERLRASWLPKVGRGWFLRAGSFETVAGQLVTDHLSVSHGEGFAGLISERMADQGLYMLDEPEAALSPKRQAELLAFLADVQATGGAQVVLATHSPILMAVPGARLLRISHRGIEEVALRDTDHFKLWQAFASDPDQFVAAALTGELTTLV